MAAPAPTIFRGGSDATTVGQKRQLLGIDAKQVRGGDLYTVDVHAGHGLGAINRWLGRYLNLIIADCRQR